MMGLSGIDILDGQMRLCNATRHLANRCGRYDDTGLVMPEAEGRALIILNEKWGELEKEKLARASERKPRPRRNRRAA